jgi:predicted Zn-dependent peptidase
MYFEHFFGVDEIMDQVERVDSDQVMAMANFLFDPAKVAVTLLGRLDGLKVTRAELAC